MIDVTQDVIVEDIDDNRQTFGSFIETPETEWKPRIIPWDEIKPFITGIGKCFRFKSFLP